MVLRDQRAHLSIGGRGAGLDRFDRGHQCLDERVIRARRSDYPARGRALLTGVPVASNLDGFRRGFDVAVVEDQDRGISTELEVNPLDGTRRDL